MACRERFSVRSRVTTATLPSNLPFSDVWVSVGQCFTDGREITAVQV